MERLGVSTGSGGANKKAPASRGLPVSRPSALLWRVRLFDLSGFRWRAFCAFGFSVQGHEFFLRWRGSLFCKLKHGAAHLGFGDQPAAVNCIRVNFKQLVDLHFHYGGDFLIAELKLREFFYF